MDQPTSADLPAMLASAADLRNAGHLDEACAVLVEAAAAFPDQAGPWRDMARLAELHREWSLAESCWRRAIALDDGQWWAFTALAAALREQRRPEDAEAVLRSAVAQFPTETMLWHDLGRLTEAGEQWTEAEACWRRFLALNDDPWWAHTSLAWVVGQQARHDEAEAILLAAATRFPDEVRPWHDVARLAETRQRWRDAARYWRRFMVLDASQWWASTGLAAALVQLDQGDDAEATLRAAIDRFPSETRPWHDLGRLAETRRTWPLAERSWRGYLALDEGAWWAHTALAAAVNEQNRHDEAEAILRAAAARFPAEPRPWHDLGRIAEARERWTDAEQCWRRFLTLDDGQSWAYTALAAALIRQDRGDDARAVLCEATARFPAETRPWHDLGRLAEARGTWPLAEECWRRYLALDDGPRWGHLALAAALIQREQWGEADRVLRTAASRFPNETRVWHDFARLWESRGKWADAVECWQRYLALDDTRSWAHTALASALTRLERWDEAAQTLRSAAERFPSEPDAWHGLARAAERRGQWAEAAEYWRRCQAPANPDSFVDRALVAVLRRQQSWDEAETVLLAAEQRFPGEYALLATQHALIAEQRPHWPMALSRWEAFSQRFPGNWTGHCGRIRALRKTGRAEAAARLVEAAMLGRRMPGPGADPGAPPPAEFASSAPSDVLARFESLGGGSAAEGAWSFGCEFGLVQRHAGVESLGLLRWASIAPTSLAAALEARFAGIDAPGDLTLRPSDGAAWGFTQNRYGIATEHTGLPLASVSAAEAERRIRQQLRFLSRKLIGDLENDEKIFIYRVVGQDIDDGLLDRIARQVASYGANRFLFVRAAPEHKRCFSVDVVRPGFMIGHIDRFASDQHGDNHEGWELVCRAALLTLKDAADVAT